MIYKRCRRRTECQLCLLSPGLPIGIDEGLSAASLDIEVTSFRITPQPCPGILELLLSPLIIITSYRSNYE